MSTAHTANSRIPLRPDPGALVARALQIVARDAVDAAKIAFTSKAAVTPTRLSDAGALALVETHFLPSLIPASAAAAVLDASIQVSFDDAAQASVPGVSLPTAGWVGEGQAISVLQGTTSAGALLSPFKLAAIVALTSEMVSGANAETVMTQVLLENVGPSLDAAFFSAAGATSISPAGILNGAIAVTPAASGPNAIAADVGNLAQALAPVSGNSSIIYIGAPRQAEILRAVLLNPPAVYASNALAVGSVVAIAPAAVAGASGAPVISISRETTVHMASPAAELVASPGTVAAPSRSVFQTDSVALKYTQELAWAKRGPGVAMITGVNWP